MKGLGRAIAIIAVLNLLAIGAGIGWLAMTERLSADRLREVRELFAETVPAEQARHEAEQREADRLAAEFEASRLPENPPATSAQLLEVRLDATEIGQQQVERLRREVEDLRRTLASDRRKLEDERTAFEAERDEFEAMRERLTEIEGDAQFRKAVGVLEGLKAAEAKQAVAALLAEGKREQVVSYLNAMDERKRNKLFNEFIGDGEAQLAAELLEDIRTRGLDPVSGSPQ